MTDTPTLPDSTQPEGKADRQTVLASIMRKHIRVDATGLAPAVASAFVFGFDEAAAEIAVLSQPQAAASRDAVDYMPIEGLQATRALTEQEVNEHLGRVCRSLAAQARAQALEEAATAIEAMCDAEPDPGRIVEAMNVALGFDDACERGAKAIRALIS